jgi:uncharacterized iron-regulated membrane protein
MSFRKVLFWCHLCVGCAAGIVIFIMSVTGALLGFERQINAWADSRYSVTPPSANVRPFSLDELRSTIQEDAVLPPSITIHSDRSAPLELSYGRERTLLVNPYSGVVLGEAPRSTRNFFATTEKLHRTLGGAMRNSFGRSLTGASNLLFLGLIVSGVFLWFPRQWTYKHIRPALWFRKNLRGRSRDWNWHNTIGFWCAIPLFFIVLCSVIMSYQWANNLLYQLTGTQPPPPPRLVAALERNHGGKRMEAAASDFLPSDQLLALVEKQSPGWKTITFRMPTGRDRAITFNTDTGNGGQPQSRSQLTIDRRTGKVPRVENFSTYNLGRKLRSIARFLHTGEILGLPGQVVATLASIGGAFLVWTGLSLALRRLADWRTRRARGKASAKTVEPLSV